MIPKRSALTIAAALVVALLPGAARAQTAAGGAPTPAAAPEAAKDTLGRDTPRGTLLGFIRAARDGNSVRAQRAIADISNALNGNPLAARMTR